jgi:Outer membrane protein beta-barrel domain
LKRIHTRIQLPLFALALLGAQFAHAQASLEVHVGLSGASDKSKGPIDTFGDGTLFNTPDLNGVFLNFGAGAMLTPRFGFGGEFSLKPGKSDYAGLQYRPIFYDFNAIVHPLTSSKRIVPELQAGLGGVNTKFYFNQQDCNGFAGCSSSSTFIQSANHFQLHTGVGVSFFLTSKVYVRPQFDLHWVNNFTQFNSNFVPQYGVSVGYRFGDN